MLLGQRGEVRLAVVEKVYQRYARVYAVTMDVMMNNGYNGR
jgi:hypothetical protein